SCAAVASVAQRGRKCGGGARCRMSRRFEREKTERTEEEFSSCSAGSVPPVQRCLLCYRKRGGAENWPNKPKFGRISFGGQRLGWDESQLGGRVRASVPAREMRSACSFARISRGSARARNSKLEKTNPTHVGTLLRHAGEGQ